MIASQNGPLPDILRVIGTATQLHHKTRHELEGACPFCGGTDRFTVSLKTNRWWCRRCSENEHWSDGYEFVQKQDGVPFPIAKAKVDGTTLPPPPRILPPLHTPEERGPVVALYDYTDEAGTLLYQKIRHEPKTFSLRRPDGAGGWLFNVTATRKVLYRLPELLARPTATVFVAEGEKDADTVTALGLLGTTCHQGANASFKWSKELAELLRGRHVVLLPDKDEPGRARVAAIALALKDIAASCLTLELPGDGKDVTDWVTAGGTREQIEALVKTARGTSEDAGPWFITGAAKPVDRIEAKWLLAPTLVDFIRECTSSMDMPTEFFVGPLLATLGAAIGNTRRIRLTEDFFEGASVWNGIIGVPGSGKTPAIRRVTAPLHTIQKRWRAEHAEEQSGYEQDLAYWEGRRKGDTASKPIAPKLRRILASDTTLEALVPLLRDNPRGILLERDELYGWIGSFNQYKKQGGADREAWLSIWNNSSFSVDRKIDNFAVYVDHPYVCVTGGIQPAKLRTLLSGPEDGFTDRLLLFWPPHKPLKLTNGTATRETQRYYDTLIESLCELMPGTAEDGSPLPITIGLDPDAYQLFEAHFNDLAERSCDPDTPEPLAQAYGKLSNQASRLALILHVCQHVDRPGSVQAARVNYQTMYCAWLLVEAAMTHLARVHGDLSLTSTDMRCKRAVDWMGRHGGRATVRDLVRANVGGVKSASHALALMHELADRHLGTTSTEMAGGSERAVFTLPKGGKA